MTRKPTRDTEAEYREWLNGGRERDAAALARSERQVRILWLLCVAFFVLAFVLHFVGVILR